MEKEVKLMLGDNIKSLKELADNSVDSIVSDPPYGLSFMGKKWDYDVPGVDFWKEVYRVLKPGGHVLSFGGTRTYHRMVVNIEDAGFEIRDQIMWLYGSGFPKSHNIGKAVDKIEGNDREVVGQKTDGAYSPGTKNKGINRLNENCEDGRKTAQIRGEDFGKITQGTSDWEGWGSALKPANEPICLARKPLSEKTIAANVLKWGTGGINIDGCRVDYKNDADKKKADPGSFNFDEEKLNEKMFNNTTTLMKLKDSWEQPEGRFPANIILDEEAGRVLDEQSGQSKSTIRKPGIKKNNHSGDERTPNTAGIYGAGSKIIGGGHTDKGGASRFFYCPKVSKKERNMGLDDFEEKPSHHNSGGIGRKCSVEKRLEENQTNTPTMKNIHPTVKPVSLMRYLTKLITPPGGICLDPFMGSGSTGIAARLEGFNFIGMEMDEEYIKIAEARINSFEEYKK